MPVVNRKCVPGSPQANSDGTYTGPPNSLLGSCSSPSAPATLPRPHLSQPKPSLQISSNIGSSSLQQNDARVNREVISSRRREANRLAAQRFRTRKKGYQDELEEKIKSLEQDNRQLMGMLDEKSPKNSSTSPDRAMPRHDSEVDTDKSNGRAPGSCHNTPHPPRSEDLPLSTDSQLPSAIIEPRLGALEMANERLQHQLQDLREENQEIKNELERMMRWLKEGGIADNHGHRPYHTGNERGRHSWQDNRPGAQSSFSISSHDRSSPHFYYRRQLSEQAEGKSPEEARHPASSGSRSPPLLHPSHRTSPPPPHLHHQPSPFTNYDDHDLRLSP
ncbi:hypothetical protein IAT38_007165 [Cryptococcus sp. DSM 104549]